MSRTTIPKTCGDCQHFIPADPEFPGTDECDLDDFDPLGSKASIGKWNVPPDWCPVRNAHAVDWRDKAEEIQRLLNCANARIDHIREVINYWRPKHNDWNIGRFVSMLDGALTQVRINESGLVKMPKIICLIGSTRFMETFATKAWELERDRGVIVLGLHLLPESYGKPQHHRAEAEDVVEKIETLHLRKIDMSDEVMVLNVGGYIGESTRREIDYARDRGKPIHYLEPKETP